MTAASKTAPIIPASLSSHLLQTESLYHAKIHMLKPQLPVWLHLEMGALQK